MRCFLEGEWDKPEGGGMGLWGCDRSRERMRHLTPVGGERERDVNAIGCQAKTLKHVDCQGHPGGCKLTRG